MGGSLRSRGALRWLESPLLKLPLALYLGHKKLYGLFIKVSVHWLSRARGFSGLGISIHSIVFSAFHPSYFSIMSFCYTNIKNVFHVAKMT
jgi:hypothetical protein